MMQTGIPVKPVDPIVAELFRARKKKGLRQQEVADKAGISRRSLVSIEAGGDCTLSTLRGLCSALGVDIEPRSHAVAGPSAPLPAPPARGFATAHEMSTHQEQRELAEALRVQAMLPFERSRWLASTWGALQRQSLGFPKDLAPVDGGAARHFATPDAKNRFDEQRETERAMRLALSRSGL